MIRLGQEKKPKQGQEKIDKKVVIVLVQGINTLEKLMKIKEIVFFGDFEP